MWKSKKELTGVSSFLRKLNIQFQTIIFSVRGFENAQHFLEDSAVFFWRLNGDFNIFVTKPLSLVFLIIAVLWILVPLILKLRGKNVIINEEGWGRFQRKESLQSMDDFLFVSLIRMNVTMLYPLRTHFPKVHNRIAGHLAQELLQ